MSYPQVEPQPNFPLLESRTLEYWKQDGTFKASVELRPAGDDGENEFVFFDGPPFANGLPHYGHLLTGFVKDAVPRYRTMRGQRVERRFGWDCHGLPAEAEAERQLGISGRQAITDFGIDKFNDYCRISVLQYTNDWERYVTRQARWVDFENDYKTLDTSYMESVIWAFKTLWDKGLIYEGFRVLPYSWALETPLSNTETRMDDAYKQVQDPAITVGFELSSGELLLAWTTTPWTLPSNLALAVAPDVDYSVIEHMGRKLIIAAERLGAYEREFPEPTIVATLKGIELVGRTYKPLFDYFANHPNSFRVLAGDFVTTQEGTGVVHLAPGFGEDDHRACQEAGIELVVPVDSRGRFTSEVPDYEGQLVFDANPAIIRVLKERGLVVRHETYDHSYPHCWRTGTPLIYKAVSSWFVKVTAIKERMLELNEQVRWVPEHLKHGSFGIWLENARDWTISRNRFFGSPIPVWRSDNPEYPRIDVYGSLEELRRDFNVEIQELHRPTIDELVRPNPDDPTGNSMMRRVPEVLDCWFESGSMPFAQVHYPFENKEWFEDHYPGDFIVEYIGQTRGWFYTLHVLATALFDRPAFLNCVSHGIVLGDDGQKMSKSLRNYPDPMKVFDSHGADAMRWYLLSSSILRGSDFVVTEEGMRDTVRQVMLPLWNSWYFLSLYANAESLSGKFDPTSEHILDRYVISKLRALVIDTTMSFDSYDLFAACAQIRTFLDVLTNWYIRRSRDRFWSGDIAAINTLHTVLHVVTRIAAPVLPLITEQIFRGLTGERSVHLQSWPTIDSLHHDDALVASMDRVRDVCSTTLSLRKIHNLRVRMPLASLIVATSGSTALREFGEIIADEVNVRKVEFTDDLSLVAAFELQVVPSVVGPRLGRDTQRVIDAVKKGEWVRKGEIITAGSIDLQPGEYQLKLVPKGSGASAALSNSEGVVVLDIALTPELEAEGAARDVVRFVQQQRREAGLNVSDRIHLRLGLPAALSAQISSYIAMISTETLATVLELVENEAPNSNLDGIAVFVSLNPLP
ncbi:MAG: isoleucine--tRNA ligase [Acidimicrobiaceae bacterium]|nr:isoleucine--tRNA ligase [Acidimicrobiaceae bacterium]